MKFSTKLIEKRRESLLDARENFILEHIPRFHQLLMRLSPFFVKYFNYMLAEQKEDPTQLTLIRGRKIVAKNF